MVLRLLLGGGGGGGGSEPAGQLPAVVQSAAGGGAALSASLCNPLLDIYLFLFYPVSASGDQPAAMAGAADAAARGGRSA